MQTIHKPYIQLCISLIFRALRNVWFEAQTLHKPYIEPYIETLQTLHKNYTQNPTPPHEPYTKLYTKPYIATAVLLRSAPKKN